MQTSLDLKSELEDLIVLLNSLGIKNDVDGPLEFCEDFKMFQGIHINANSRDLIGVKFDLDLVSHVDQIFGKESKTFVQNSISILNVINRFILVKFLG